MQLFLSTNIDLLVGTIHPSFGYVIKSRTLPDGRTVFFTSRRTNAYFNRLRPEVQRTAHLRFIFAIAQLAQNPLYIRDVALPVHELIDALYEAGYDILANLMVANSGLYPVVFNAQQILDFKQRKGL